MIVEPTWRRQNLNKSLKPDLESEHMGEGPESLPLMCKNKMVAWIPIWLHWSTLINKVRRFLGPKFGICGTELNVGKEIWKEVHVHGLG